MKKLRCLLLMALSLLMTFSLVSCSSPLTDEQVQEILCDLVPRSQQLNEIFWSDALPLADEDAEPMMTVSSAQYYEVSSECEYQSVEELKAAAEAVFSSDYLDDIYPILFDGYAYTEEDDEDTEYSVQPRYSNDEDGILCRDIASFSLNLTTTIDPSTARVVEFGEDLVKAEVDCTINGEQTTMEITLRCENGVWLIDSPTY